MDGAGRYPNKFTNIVVFEFANDLKPTGTDDIEIPKYLIKIK
jgi:hypothetical protein